MICRRVEFIPAAAKINRTYAKSIPARVEMLPAGVEIISGGVETASASLELIPTAAPQTFSNGKSASATQMLPSAHPRLISAAPPGLSLYLPELATYSPAGESPSMAGPLRTWPSVGSKREPWQGQSQDFSLSLKATTHPKWVQTAENSWSAPASSRKRATFERPR